jgi:membrane protease YdiL (CAAX protease family)
MTEILRIVLFGAVFLAVEAAAAALPDAAAPIAGPALAAVALAAYAGLVRWLDHRRADELARPVALTRSVPLGILMFAAVFTGIALLGGVRRVGAGSVSGALAVAGVMAAAAVAEELMFRAILFTLFERLMGTRWALAVSGLAFGLLHLVNPGATVWGAIAIAVEAGLMLGAVYAATRDIWWAIGLHFGWNLAEGGIFGTTVSGAAHGPDGLLRTVLAGPVALTGGGFGPEASVVAIAVCAIPTVLFLRRARMRPRARRGLATAVRG